MAELSIPRRGVALQGEGRRSLVALIGTAIRQRMAFNRAIRELRALSDRDLEDLGIDRKMITRVALEASRRS